MRKPIIRGGRLFASEAEANASSSARRLTRRKSSATIVIGDTRISEIHAESSPKSRRLRKIARRKAGL